MCNMDDDDSYLTFAIELQLSEKLKHVSNSSYFLLQISSDFDCRSPIIVCSYLLDKHGILSYTTDVTNLIIVFARKADIDVNKIIQDIEQLHRLTLVYIDDDQLIFKANDHVTKIAAFLLYYALISDDWFAFLHDFENYSLGKLAKYTHSHAADGGHYLCTCEIGVTTKKL